MEKIRLGRTGMMVTKLGFGGIPIQRLTEEDAVDVVKRCMDLGINFIDTANGYSTSEERIGKAIKGKRDQVILATKSHNRTTDGIAGDIELSLERLGVDSIDLFQFHQVFDQEGLDKVLATDGPMSVVEGFQKQGKIKHIGITSHSLDTAILAVKTDRFATMQFPFNFITNDPADELLGRMVHYVSDLQAGNVMNRGQVNSLTTKLEQAITRLHRDHLRQALNILNTFQNQISGFIAVGVLPEVNGIYLLDESSFILDMLCEFGIAADGISLHLQNSLPADCFLSQAYPNPFNSSTQMSFTLPGPEKVQMQVYNLTGKMVSTIQDGCLSTGVHSVNWHAGDLPGGIYIVQFKAGSFQGYNKVALVR